MTRLDTTYADISYAHTAEAHTAPALVTAQPDGMDDTAAPDSLRAGVTVPVDCEGADHHVVLTENADGSSRIATPSHRGDAAAEAVLVALGGRASPCHHIAAGIQRLCGHGLLPLHAARWGGRAAGPVSDPSPSVTVTNNTVVIPPLDFVSPSKTFTRRWKRGKSMAGPAWSLAIVLAGTWVWLANVLPRGADGSRLSTILFSGGLSFILGGLVWFVLVHAWDGVIYITSSPRQRNTDLRCRQITYAEAAYQLERATQQLQQALPAMALGAIWSVASGKTDILAADAALSYAFIIRPLQYWQSVMNAFRAGQDVWVEVPPEKDGYCSLVIWLYTLTWLGFVGWDIHSVWVFVVVGAVVFLCLCPRMVRAVERNAIRRDTQS